MFHALSLEPKRSAIASTGRTRDLRPSRPVYGWRDDAPMSSTVLESTTLEERATVLSALGDPIRLQVLDELGSGQRCVCELQETIDVAPNLLSYHLRVLREAGLVDSSKRGRWVDYRLASAATELVRGSLPVELIERMR